MLNFPWYLAEVCLLIIFLLIFSYLWLRFVALFIFLLVFQLYLAEVCLLIIFLLVFQLYLAEVCLIITLLLNFPLYLAEFALLSSYFFQYMWLRFTSLLSSFLFSVISGWSLLPYYLPTYFKLHVAEVCPLIIFLLIFSYLWLRFAALFIFLLVFQLYLAEVCLVINFLLNFQLYLAEVCFLIILSSCLFPVLCDWGWSPYYLPTYFQCYMASVCLVMNFLLNFQLYLAEVCLLIIFLVLLAPLFIFITFYYRSITL